MKYFYDTEFIEDGKTIDLISIGIISEDNRKFYAISTEFKAKKADKWVKDNVLSHLPNRYVTDLSSPNEQQKSLYWMPRKEIKRKLLEFIGDDIPEFWAYYADYDHVALCQLFGKMIDLPKGWPMYTNDVKQLHDNCYSTIVLPEQCGDEHEALADAMYCKYLYDYLNKLISVDD